jgi:hypothetical protein
MAETGIRNPYYYIREQIVAAPEIEAMVGLGRFELPPF